MSTMNQPENTSLETAIEELISALRATEETSDEYSNLVDQLAKLHKLKVDELKLRQEADADLRKDNLAREEQKHTVESENRRFKQVSADTWAAIGANIGIVLIVVGHERANVVRTSVKDFLVKKIG